MDDPKGKYNRERDGPKFVGTPLINYLCCLISLDSDFIAIIFTHLHGIKVQRLEALLYMCPITDDPGHP